MRRKEGVISNQLNVTSALLNKYNKAGPRYTSYPTAPMFTEAFTREDYLRILQEANERRAGQPISVYFHIPFCRKRCTFCACSSYITLRDDVIEKYVDVLKKEISLIGRLLSKRFQYTQLHFGGGSPNILEMGIMADLMTHFEKHFAPHPNAEKAIEIDPRTISEAYIEKLRGLGFNRISLGVQDFTPQVQTAVNRIQPEDATRKVLDACRNNGFKGINIDLIYGLPYQSQEGFRETLEKIIDMKPDRIAVFNFAYVPWMRPHQKRLDPASLPGPELKLELVAMVYDMLQKSGYRSIGMDHFALEDDMLCKAQDEKKLTRNFQGYSLKLAPDLIGFGVTSIGETAEAYHQNQKKISTYYADVEKGMLPIMRGYELSPDDLIRRHVIRELMCNLSISYHQFQIEWGVDFLSYFKDLTPDFVKLENDQLISTNIDGIQITPLGKIFIRNVAMTFDKYLKAEKKEMYSKTV